MLTRLGDAPSLRFLDKPSSVLSGAVCGLYWIIFHVIRRCKKLPSLMSIKVPSATSDVRDRAQVPSAKQPQDVVNWTRLFGVQMVAFSLPSSYLSNFLCLTTTRALSQGTDCQLAIETSGHAALKENWMLDDGAYLALKVCWRHV